MIFGIAMGVISLCGPRASLARRSGGSPEGGFSPANRQPPSSQSFKDATAFIALAMLGLGGHRPPARPSHSMITPTDPAEEPEIL
jgi:hypothetical protein